MLQSSPLLDQYNQDGIVTPLLQKALDTVKRKLPQFQLQQPAPAATRQIAPPGPQFPLIQQTPTSGAPGPGSPEATAPRLLTPPGMQFPTITRPQAASPSLVSPGGQAPPQTALTLGAPTTPLINRPAAGAPSTRLITDQAQRDRLIDTGSGLDQLGARISKIENPWLRGLSRVGQGLLRGADIAGTAFFPAITEGIPGTELHHEGLVRRAERVVDKDVARAKENAATANLEAETQKNLQGHIPTNELELWAQQNPGKSVEDFLKLKRENAPERNETPFDVWRRQNPKAPAEEWLKTEEGAKYHAPNEYEDFKAGILKNNPQTAPDEIVKQYAAAHQPPARTPQNEYEDFKGDYLKKNPQADAFEISREYAKAHQSPQRPPESLMLIPDGKGGYTTQVVGAGQHIAGGAVTPTQAGSQNTPTTQMRNVAAQAQLVHEQTPYMLAEIDRLKDKLGPMAGRWNEVMQGKLGIQDADMAGIRADLLMYSSAVALMHARGRLPENLREEFDRTINNPGQDFQNLKAVITKIDNWTVKNPGVKDTGGAGGGGNAQGGYQVGHVYGGMTYLGGDPNNEASWRKR